MTITHKLSCIDNSRPLRSYHIIDFEDGAIDGYIKQGKGYK